MPMEIILARKKNIYDLKTLSLQIVKRIFKRNEKLKMRKCLAKWANEIKNRKAKKFNAKQSFET